MGNLAFIRSATCWDCWDYFENKTDVWVFGDAEGYDYFRQQLLHAEQGSKNIRLTLLEQHPTSMMSVILPPINDGAVEARLKFIERFTSGKTGPNMELVIFGNQSGYRYLAGKLMKLESEFAGQPSEHIHLDDLVDPHIVARSVSLNLRGTIRTWAREHFEEYAELILNRSENFLPTDIGYRLNTPEEYEEISARGSEFLNLRKKGASPKL